MSKLKSSEHQEQCVVKEWAVRSMYRYPPLRWLFAVPNGAKLPYFKSRSGARISREALWLKAEGLEPGVSDLVLPWPECGYHGVFLEMKYGNNKPTDKQNEFIIDMQAAGYAALACWGADDAIEFLQHYVDGDCVWIKKRLLVGLKKPRIK